MEEQPNIMEGLDGTATAPAKDTKSYPMDMSPVNVRINIFPSLDKPHYVTHILRKPTFEEEDARERKMPIYTSDAGKVDGANAFSTTIDDEVANILLYDKIIEGVKGYVLKNGEKPSENPTSPDEKIQTPKGESTVRELIPPSHKSTAIDGMFMATYNVKLGEGEDEEFTFALGGGREWNVEQEIGVKPKLEDGTYGPADYKVIYTFREPTEAERKKFRNEAIIALNMRQPNGTMKERRSVSLKVVRNLFDSLVVAVENATVEGKPLNASDKTHVEMIPANFKKGCILKLFNFLEADLGN